MTSEAMTEAEARERLLNVWDRASTPAGINNRILATTDALAVLLDWHELGKRATPEQLTALLRGAEEAGRATCQVDWVTTKVVPLIPQMNEEKRVENWRIVPDEEGAT